jgi:hypothetical protein
MLPSKWYDPKSQTLLTMGRRQILPSSSSDLLSHFILLHFLLHLLLLLLFSLPFLLLLLHLIFSSNLCGFEPYILCSSPSSVKKEKDWNFLFLWNSLSTLLRVELRLMKVCTKGWIGCIQSAVTICAVCSPSVFSSWLLCGSKQNVTFLESNPRTFPMTSGSMREIVPLDWSL